MKKKNSFVPEHMESRKFVSHGIPVSRVHVKSKLAAALLGKACGTYTTIQTGALDEISSFEEPCTCLVEQLRPLLKPYFGKRLCICSVGNRDHTFGALGWEVAKRFLPSMYDMFRLQSNFEKIAVICPDTKRYTNLSGKTIISSIASTINAGCILTIDSTNCKDVKQLCGAIQLTAGKTQFCWGTSHLHFVPVVSISVPTTISMERLSRNKGPEYMRLLTPDTAANAVTTAAFIIACAITQIAYPGLDYEDCKRYIRLFQHGIL